MKFWARTLASLFEQHRSRLLSMAVRRMQDREVAAELVQDVYLRMMQHGSVGSRDENIKVLYTAVRNAVIDHHRSIRNHSRSMESLLPSQLWEQQETHSPQDHAEARQALGALDQALLELSPRAREMFLAHRVDGISNAKLAKKYDISVSAVEKQLARTIRHCQERLAAHIDRD
ncbi:RNA polymerase subunit sigma-24 [Thalassospira profundimaris]|uniref:RNA polymerase subunit sigma-24 n=1 Tax=Thalassospira profundimaris TaxID=502049 RepID=A0A367XCF6_9PROT|nr:sigma-70 family RNA polymerase sigma factor [Thalassospira profundimaris]RCK50810.1 RNA polymerase subunit sigma-24 [Thalassospira profundimaris]